MLRGASTGPTHMALLCLHTQDSCASTRHLWLPEGCVSCAVSQHIMRHGMLHLLEHPTSHASFLECFSERNTPVITSTTCMSLLRCAWQRRPNRTASGGAACPWCSRWRACWTSCCRSSSAPSTGAAAAAPTLQAHELALPLPHTKLPACQHGRWAQPMHMSAQIVQAYVSTGA